MTNFIDPGRVRACIRRLAQAGQALAGAQAEVTRLERRSVPSGDSRFSSGVDASDLSRARERVDREKRNLQALRGEAQRFLGDVRRAVSASRQDLGGLEQIVHNASSARAGLEDAGRWRRKDRDQLQALQRELEAALSAPLPHAEGGLGGLGGDPYLTGSRPTSGDSLSSSPSFRAIEEAVFRSRQGRSGLEEKVGTTSGYITKPASPSRDFDPYAIPVSERFRNLWLPKAEGASAHPLDDAAEAYYRYRKDHPLSERVTLGRKYVQTAVALFSRGGQGYSGRYGS